MTETETERWVSKGQRVWNHQKGELVDVWLDPSDREARYEKFQGLVVGGVYEVQVDRSGDGLRVHGLATYTGERIDDPDQVAIWQAETMVARGVAAKRRQERSLARKADLLDDALADVDRLVVKCRSYPEFQALSTAVQMRMMDRYDKRRS